MARLITTSLAASLNGGPPLLCDLKIEQEVITYRSEREVTPDFAWQHIDKAGHYHAYNEDGTLPTLTAREKHMPCNGMCGGTCGGEGYSVTRHECRICGKKVKPGTNTAYDVTRSMPGLKWWEVTVWRAPWELMRSEVSVRVDDENRTYFGIGLATDVQGDETGCTLKIVGNGQLGMKKGTS